MFVAGTLCTAEFGGVPWSKLSKSYLGKVFFKAGISGSVGNLNVHCKFLTISYRNSNRINKIPKYFRAVR